MFVFFYDSRKKSLLNCLKGLQSLKAQITFYEMHSCSPLPPATDHKGPIRQFREDMEPSAKEVRNGTQLKMFSWYP